LILFNGGEAFAAVQGFQRKVSRSFERNVLSEIEIPFWGEMSASASESDLSSREALASFTPLGTMVQAHPNETFYASHSSVFVDDNGQDFHTFYCSSVKPFVRNEDPGWGTNEKNTFYGADAVRYQRLDSKLNRVGEIRTAIIGGLEYKPSLGLKTIKLVQSPCTSTTVKFRDLYYTFFESFTDGAANAQMVAIHVMRAAKPGHLDPEVLTTAGWKKMRTATEPWKAIIRSQSFKNYPAYRSLINQGLSGLRENYGPNSHGNLLWGVGVPSAVVKDGEIFLIAWDNVAYPERCRLEKVSGRWQVPAGVFCGSMILASSRDGQNFEVQVRPDLPSGEIKIVRDPGFSKDGQFAFFSQILDETLKSKNQIGLNVVFFTPDLRSMTSWHQLATVPSRVPPTKYWDLGGIVAPRVAGNSIGEISPFSRPTLLQMSLPRISQHSKPESIAENREIFAWRFQFLSDMSRPGSPVALAAPAEKADPAMPPVLTSAEVLKDSRTTYGLHLCGKSFTNKAAIRAKWSHLNKVKWYRPETAGSRAIHYIHPLATPAGHARFCVVAALTASEVNSLCSGKTLTVQIYQPSANVTSAPIVLNSSNVKLQSESL
jgi:hypothetical protein